MASILPNGKTQFVDQNGKPLAGGSVTFYLPGTTTKKDTWQDQAMTQPNTNPVVLDSRGQATIWGSGSYRQVVADVNSVQIWDQVVVDSLSSAALSASGATPGASLVGIDGTTLDQQFKYRANRVVDSIASLRTLSSATYTRAYVSGYYAPHDGGGGSYQVDASDTTSADNGGTIIVASDGARWKLSETNAVCWGQFGAKGDGSTDDTAAINSARASGVFRGKQGSTYVITDYSIVTDSRLSGNSSLSYYGYSIPTGQLISGASGGAVSFFNFSPMKLKKWRAALGRVRAGTGGAKLVCMGDSTTAGAWSNNSFYVNCFLKAYPKQLASIFSGFGIPSTGEGTFGGHNWGATKTGLMQYDPRLSLGGNWDISSGIFSIGAEAIAILLGTGTLSFTPSIPVDTFEIYYIKNASLGGFTVKINGGSVVATIDTSGGSGSIQVATITCPLGTNRVDIDPTGSGQVFIVGLNGYNSAIPGVRIFNAGWSGGKAADIGGASSPWASGNALPYVAPDLTIICCTINDSNNGTSLASYNFFMQALITSAKQTGDVVLMTGAPSNTPQATNGTLQQFLANNYALAVSNDVPLIDITARWQSWAVSQPLGFYGTGENIHPSGPGYADIAQAIAGQLSKT